VKLFGIAYFMWMGYMVRKTGLDEKIFRKAEIMFDALAARAGEEFGAAFRETSGIPALTPASPVTDVPLPGGM
jgi:hypothetical protein